MTFGPWFEYRVKTTRDELEIAWEYFLSAVDVQGNVEAFATIFAVTSDAAKDLPPFLAAVMAAKTKEPSHELLATSAYTAILSGQNLRDLARRLDATAGLMDIMKAMNLMLVHFPEHMPGAPKGFVLLPEYIDYMVERLHRTGIVTRQEVHTKMILWAIDENQKTGMRTLTLATNPIISVNTRNRDAAIKAAPYYATLTTELVSKPSSLTYYSTANLRRVADQVALAIAKPVVKLWDQAR